MLTLAQILDAPTQDEALAEIVALLGDAGFTVDSWKPGTLQHTMLVLCAYLYAQNASYAAALALQTFNQSSTGDWLTVLSDSHFDNARVSGSAAIGSITMTLTPGFGSYTWDPAQCSVRINDDYVYTHRDRITLGSSAGYTGSFAFVAAADGVAYNVPNNSSCKLTQTTLGVSVANPPVSGTTSWLLRPGTDEETDDTLRLRNSTKWSTLTTSEVVIDRVKSITYDADPSITDVYVDDTNPAGPGTVYVWCAGAYATAGGAAVAAAQTRLQSAFFDGASRISCFPAPVLQFESEYNQLKIWHSPGADTTALTDEISAALDAWIADVPIGGNLFSVGYNYIASISSLVDVLSDITSVRKVVPTYGGTPKWTDITLGDTASNTYLKLARPVAGWASILTFYATSV